MVLYSFEPLRGLTSSMVVSAHEGPAKAEFDQRSIELLDRQFSCRFNEIPGSATTFSATKFGSFHKGELCDCLATLFFYQKPNVEAQLIMSFCTLNL